MTSNLNLTFKKIELVDFQIHLPTIFNNFREHLLSLDYAQVNLPTKQCTYLLSQHQNKDWLTLWKLTDSRDPSSQKAAPWQGRLW